MWLLPKAMEYLEENDFEYEEINIDHNPEAKEFLKQVGIQLVPTTILQAYSSKVVVVDYLHYQKNK